MEVNRGLKVKTMVNVINRKVDDWLRDVAKKDAQLAKDIGADFILTGGAITSMLLGEKPNDFDIYFQTPEIAKRVAEFYIQPLVKKGMANKVEVSVVNDDQVVIKGIIDGDGEEVQTLDDVLVKWTAKKKVDYKPVLVTSNAITLFGDIQLITRFVGKPAEIHKKYDFIHCTNYYTRAEGMVLNMPAVECVMARELRYQSGTAYPVATMFRLRKFIKRGWTISAGEIVKIAFNVSKLDLSDVKVLQEQLVGVDIAYFAAVISILKKEAGNREIDGTYLGEVINRVFDEADDDFFTPNMTVARSNGRLSYQDRAELSDWVEANLVDTTLRPVYDSSS